MSIPNISGYIESSRPISLEDLWKRSAEPLPAELWPADMLRRIVPESTGWLTVSEHFFTARLEIARHGTRGLFAAAVELQLGQP